MDMLYKKLEAMVYFIMKSKPKSSLQYAISTISRSKVTMQVSDRYKQS